MSAQVLDERFWAKVDQSGECWIWTGYKDSRGYGQVRRNGQTMYAHRYALALSGVILGGRSVDHACHNPSCVRPEHLRCATNKQNSENLTGPYANSSSGIRGVWWDRRAKRWHASVGHNGVQHRKRFETVEDAVDWVRAKRIELFTHNDLDRLV